LNIIDTCFGEKCEIIFYLGDYEGVVHALRQEEEKEEDSESQEKKETKTKPS